MITDLLIVLHAGLGGLSLAGGLAALLSAKGSRPHRLGGKVFFWSLLPSSLIAMSVAVLPGHVNPILLLIGTFTVYMLLSGYRSLAFYRRGKPNYADFVLSLAMFLAGAGMIAAGVIVYPKYIIVLSVFGVIGLFLSVQDWMLFQRKEVTRKEWLQRHLTMMSGGMIAAVSAFIVVNGFLPGLVGWLSPTVIGTAYIIFWSRKVGSGNPRSSVKT